MRLNTANILLILIFYFVSEEFILKWLPVPEIIYSILRYLGEIVVYFLFFKIALTRLFNRRGIYKTPINIIILCLIFSMIISGLINASPWLNTFLKIRIIFRYVAVTYILIHITVTEEYVRTVIKMLLILGISQAVIGLYQQNVEVKVTSFWKPRETQFTVGTVTRSFRDVPARRMIGTMSEIDRLTAFFLIANVVFASMVINSEYNSGFLTRKMMIISFLVVFLATALSFSRTVMLLSLISFFLIANYLGNWKILSVILAVILILLTPPLIVASLAMQSDQVSQQKVDRELRDPVNEIKGAFSLETYQKNLESTRGWFVSEVVSSLSNGMRIFGYGSDDNALRKAMYRDGASARILVYGPIYDVYWFKVMANFGFVGIAIYLALFFRLISVSKWLYYHDDNQLYQHLALICRTLLVCFLIYGLITPVFDLRPIAFIFWFLMGLMINRYLYVKKINSSTSNPNSNHAVQFS